MSSVRAPKGGGGEARWDSMQDADEQQATPAQYSVTHRLVSE